MAKQKVEVGSSQAEAKFRITVTEKGPYLVFGRPPLAQQFIVPNARGESWEFREGRHFNTDSEPTALCRCGASGNKPYCDGSHTSHKWDSEPSSPPEALLDNVEITSGKDISITDNTKYCVFARFCDAYGGVWSLTEASEDPQARDLAIREASMCPSGRLMAWDKGSQKALRIQIRAEPRTDRRRSHWSERRSVGSRRNTHRTRERAELRDSQPQRTVPLRHVRQQAVLRRHPRIAALARRDRGERAGADRKREGVLAVRVIDRRL